MMTTVALCSSGCPGCWRRWCVRAGIGPIARRASVRRRPGSGVRRRQRRAGTVVGCGRRTLRPGAGSRSRWLTLAGHRDDVAVEFFGVGLGHGGCPSHRRDRTVSSGQESTEPGAVPFQVSMMCGLSPNARQIRETTARAISVFDPPSAHASTIRDRIANACAVFRRRDHPRNTSRPVSDNTTGSTIGRTPNTRTANELTTQNPTRKPLTRDCRRRVPSIGYRIPSPRAARC